MKNVFALVFAAAVLLAAPSCKKTPVWTADDFVGTWSGAWQTVLDGGVSVGTGGQSAVLEISRDHSYVLELTGGVTTMEITVYEGMISVSDGYLVLGGELDERFEVIGDVLAGGIDLRGETIHLLYMMRE
ncbi:MAG: hypothetical protein IAC23_10235 [Bacteroidetes bacterium]|uniref:Lipocalin-like domain-containing protein n=1 Tax=Candidatus Cryptobacteroides merdavium TaxID=2840769 RepID=A0A9D9EJ15_9BACT|nr:hypothetical protein [Candidatus Cryptobacteroides merdavium]